MKKKLFTVLALCVALTTACFAFSACGSKKTDWEYIQEKGEIIVGFDVEFPPMTFKEDGAYKGFDIEMSKAIGEKLGVKIKFQEIVWSKKENELQSKNIDAIFCGFTENEERAANMNFSVPYMKNYQVAIVRADSTYTTIESLKGKALAAQDGSTAMAAINGNEFLKDNDVTKVDNNIQAVNTELKGRTVEAVVLDSVVAYYTFGDNADFRIIAGDLASEKFVGAFRLGDNLLTFKINQAIYDLQKENKLDAISMTYFKNTDALIKY